MTLFVDILVCILIWFVGTALFSFMNVIRYRYIEKKKIFNEDFTCDSCGTELKPLEAFPVFSYLFLKGKCRYCGEKLSLYDFVNELIGGFVLVFVFLRFGDGCGISSGFILSEPIDSIVHFNLENFAYVVTAILFVCLLDLVVMVDHKTMEIPNIFVIATLVVSVLSLITMRDVGIIEHLIGALVISVPMFVITLIVKGGFGGGDVKLSFAAGLMLGWKLAIVGFFIGLLLGGLYAIIKLSTKKIDKKAHFAFGPYLCIGYMMALICGANMLWGYLKLAAILHG